MTLLTRHIDAGWHEVERRGPNGFVAEKNHAQPGATSTVLREEAASQDELHRKLDLRESQLSNEGAVVIYLDKRVTGAEHAANQLLGTHNVPSDADVVGVPTPEQQHAAAALSPEEEAWVQQPSEFQEMEVPAALSSYEFVTTNVRSAEGSPLTDEERAKLRSDEDELEAGKVDGIEPPTDPGLVEPPAAA